MYLGSQDDEAFTEMLAAQAKTDESLSQITTWYPFAVSSVQLSSPESMQYFIKFHRKLLSFNTVTLNQNLEWYSNLTSAILDTLVELVQVPDDEIFWKFYMSYDSILRSIDTVGIQRALGSVFYSTCGLSSANLQWFRTLDNMVCSYHLSCLHPVVYL